MIYVNGDSHSYGLDLDIADRYSSIVARHFNHECVNESHPGASNQRILRTAQEYLNVNQPDLVIIGWTTWEREEWLHNGQYFNVNSSGYDNLAPELESKYKEWVMYQNEDTLQLKSDYWHQKIWDFHQELKNKNIKHLFFNCMYNFFNVTNLQDWSNSFIGPYDNASSYYWHLKSQGFTTDEWYHYKQDGHAYWANVLIDYINKNNLL